MSCRSGRAKRKWIPAALLFATALAAAPLPHAWRNWHYSRAIELPKTDSPQLAGIVVPQDVFQRSQAWLPDLRIMDDSGAEAPFALRVNEGSTNTVPLPTTLRENSFAPGEYTQIVLDLGEKTRFHNALEIQTPESDFIEWVSVEASDDAHLWRIVQTRAPFFRFQKESLRGTQTISYSENNARYLRIHILDGAEQFNVSGAAVLYKTVTAPESIPLEATFTPSTSTTQGTSTWTADFGVEGMPVSSVRFDVAAPAEFIRSVDIETSDDNQEWQPFARGEIYRYRQAGAAQEQLTVSIPFGGAQGRYWRIELASGNDAPLEGVALHLSALSRHVFFEQLPGRSYRMLYGQSRAETPHYDLERRLDAKAEATAVAGQVGSEEKNSDYSDPRPWTEKNAYFLWVVLGIAVLLLGYSAVQSLRRSSAPSTPSA